jgi:hypothetical protein
VTGGGDLACRLAIILYDTFGRFPERDKKLRSIVQAPTDDTGL